MDTINNSIFQKKKNPHASLSFSFKRIYQQGQAYISRHYRKQQRHRVLEPLRSVKNHALGKESLCRMPDNVALGKDLRWAKPPLPSA
jgi:hypothetical protein